VECDSARIESLWKDKVEAGDNEHTTFATSGAMLLRTFDDLDRIAHASELTWATQFYGLLALGGHSLRSIRLDGYVWEPGLSVPSYLLDPPTSGFPCTQRRATARRPRSPKGD
jgi:hypothetical protein